MKSVDVQQIFMFFICAFLRNLRFQESWSLAVIERREMRTRPGQENLHSPLASFGNPL